MSHSKLSNRTPKSKPLFSEACDECQTLITRLRDVAKDPAKMAELKLLLGMLCHEVSYEEECKLFVNKLDLFVNYLLPYLNDPHRVCQFLHICENNKIEQFHRIGMLYARKYVNRAKAASDLMCEECQFAAHELDEIIQEKDFQQEVHDWLSQNVCNYMGKYKATCDLLLEDFLPNFWEQFHEILKDNKQFCVELDMCDQASGVLEVEGAGSRKVSHRVFSTVFN
jgi:hypothetical protein